MDKNKAVELLKQALLDIPKLRNLRYNNQEFKLWYEKVETIIKAGLNNDDYLKFSKATVTVLLPLFDSEIQNAHLRSLKNYEIALKSMIQKYEILGTESEPDIEQESKDTTTLPIDLFDKMQFHPRVIEASESLFKTGNYASAIFEAFKAVHNYVQDKTGLTLDGANLMEKVFNENKPILQLNELLTPSDKNEQKGFKHIFMGSQIGIRNPKAHENVKQEDPTRTLEYLSIASLLMRRIDESKLVKLNI